jgi:hypothetical protein
MPMNGKLSFHQLRFRGKSEFNFFQSDFTGNKALYIEDLNGAVDNFVDVTTGQ